MTDVDDDEIVWIGCFKPYNRTIGRSQCDGRSFTTLLFTGFYVFIPVTFFTLIICYIVEGSEKLKKWAGNELNYVWLWMLFIVSCSGMLVIVICIALRCKRVYVPRYLNGSRRFMKSHRMSLHSILKHNYWHVPKPEDLVIIDEEGRKNLTELQSVTEEVLKYQSLQVLLTGSSAERFNVPLSSLNLGVPTGGVGEDSHAIITDFDYMMSPKFDKASFNADNNNKYLILTDIEGLHAGFVSICDGNGVEISSRKMKENILTVTKQMKLRGFSGYRPPEKCCCSIYTFKINNSGQVKIKGPAIEIRMGDTNVTNRFFADVTFALECVEWPKSLSNWSYRPNKNWPYSDDVARIVDGGCHFVPKSQPGDNNGLTWRISFSRAEVELSKLVPPVVRACFIGLKVIAKDYLSITCSRITSYHLKCVLYNTLEKSDPKFWQENMEDCFYHLLHNLIQCVVNKECPHFWIPSINLFEEFTDNDFCKLLKVLNNIEKEPEHYIEKFPGKVPILEEDEPILTRQPKEYVKNYGTIVTV